MTDRGVAPDSRSSSRSAEPTEAVVGTVLLVEDDPSMAELLTTALGARGLTVIVTRSAAAALQAAEREVADLVLLDLGLPDLDGLEVCRRIRQYSELPVIVLTADGDEERKVAALDLGADDYVTKPFSTPELMARVRVALRRAARAAGATVRPDPGTHRVGALHLDTDRYQVTVDGEALRLTHKEFQILAMLAARDGGLVPHRELLDEVWDGKGSAESLRVHVTNLRRKLGSDSGVEIRTDTGVGYRLVAVAGG